MKRELSGFQGGVSQSHIICSSWDLLKFRDNSEYQLFLYSFIVSAAIEFSSVLVSIEKSKKSCDIGLH